MKEMQRGAGWRGLSRKYLPRYIVVVNVENINTKKLVKLKIRETFLLFIII